MPSIIIASTDIIEDANIPANFKNNSVCGEANLTPNISWVEQGFSSAAINYWNIYVEDLGIGGSSVNGLFLHMSVDAFSPTQTYIDNTRAFQGGTINSTDYGSGDNPATGWNGPCTTGSGLYRITVEAKIKESTVSFVWPNPEDVPADRIVRGTYEFKDNETTATVPPQTGDCGTLFCPPGSELIDGLCQTITAKVGALNDKQYTVSAGSASATYGNFGTRFYADTDSFIIPFRANDAQAELEEDYGSGAALPYTVINTGTSIWHNVGNTSDGRLNIAGIWSNEGSLPEDEWIGFSTCIDVPVTKKYCIGLAADNRMRFKINGELIAVFDRNNKTRHFNYWHVIEITLNQGANIVELEGLNEGSIAAFAAEFYDTDITTLSGLTTLGELEPYIIFTTRDKVGDEFDIGEDSGFTCPDGTAYNSCEGGDCQSITYKAATPIVCCSRIVNCVDENETYLIQLDPSETTTLGQGSVYVFAGNPDLDDKCFVYETDEVCGGPNYAQVTVVTNHGFENCVVCDPSQKFESCETPGEFIYLKLADGESTPVLNNIYDFTSEEIEGCWKWLEEVNDTFPEYRDVEFDVEYGVTDCIVCIPCLKFQNCVTATEVELHLEDGQATPVIGNIYELDGDPAINSGCWKHTAITTCVATVVDVTIEKDYECAECDVCVPYYLLTDCADPENTMFIQWEAAETPLDVTRSYIFDFDSDVCYTPSAAEARPCEDLPGPIYNAANITSDTDGCETCNSVCYRLLDCDAYAIQGTTDDLSLYVGKVVKWQDEADAPNYVERCAIVESYICRQEAYPEPTITILDCFDTCLSCDPPAEPEAEPTIGTQRHVKPGYNTPDCNN